MIRLNKSKLSKVTRYMRSAEVALRAGQQEAALEYLACAAVTIVQGATVKERLLFVRATVNKTFDGLEEVLQKKGWPRGQPVDLKKSIQRQSRNRAR